jgi:O-antigen/teichoic acid export membrane protein
VVVGLAAVINQLIALPLLENLLPGTLEENRAQAGIYSAAAKLAVLMNLFTQAFNYAAEPFFFSHATRTDARELYGRVAQAFALVGSVVFAGILLYLDLIKYFLGAHLREGLGVVPVLLLAYFFLGLYYNFSIWYKLADRTKIGAYISVGGMIITLLINFMLVPNPLVGYYGAALAALACYGFMATASYFTGQRYYPIEYPIWKILAYIGTAIAVYMISLALQPLTGGSLWLSLLINTVLMGAYLFGFYRLEGKAIRELIRS